MKLSAVIIAKNEETVIKKCLASLKFAMEIIVLDNESSDKTAEIAEKAGAKVIPVIGRDFSYLRNIAREKSAGEWLLYIDADEIVSSELGGEIVKAITSPSGNVAYTLRRKNNFLGTNWPGEEKMIRLFRKKMLLGWQGSLHESPQVAGKIGRLNNPLFHFTHRDISSMVAKTNEWSETEAILRYKNNHPLMSPLRFFSVMVKAFYKSYISNRSWTVGTVGMIESVYQAFSIFITYAKLWEKQNKRNK